ncbi:MerR family transcriptional regulator [Nocardiopsis synnemataformans]|uniref:MerR family transcriptional regulator n=1 Tax=Nocardiopsis synnemataformans TaxID=61305 RepID=UPI003EBD2A32
MNATEGESIVEMTVGAAAKAAGVSAKAVRLWESKHLLPPAQRTEAGYRLFTDADVAVLCFIRQAKTLGLTLAEITVGGTTRVGDGAGLDEGTASTRTATWTG